MCCLWPSNRKAIVQTSLRHLQISNRNCTSLERPLDVSINFSNIRCDNAVAMNSSGTHTHHRNYVWAGNSVQQRIPLHSVMIYWQTLKLLPLIRLPADLARVDDSFQQFFTASTPTSDRTNSLRQRRNVPCILCASLFTCSFGLWPTYNSRLCSVFFCVSFFCMCVWSFAYSLGRLAESCADFGR